jgi:adenine deaminase
MNSMEKVRIARKLDKAPLVLKNAQIVNVFTGLVEKGDIAIGDGRILGIGSYEGIEEVDLSGKYVWSGVHRPVTSTIESSMLTPPEFSESSFRRERPPSSPIPMKSPMSMGSPDPLFDVFGHTTPWTSL